MQLYETCCLNLSDIKWYKMKNIRLCIRVDEYTNLKLEEMSQEWKIEKSAIVRASLINLIKQTVDEDGNIKKTIAIEQD